MKRRGNKAECFIVAAVLGAGTAAAADEPAETTALESAEEPAIDAAFLEYLGSWEDTDEDWMLFADDEDSAVADGDKPSPDDESAEKTDET